MRSENDECVCDVCSVCGMNLLHTRIQLDHASRNNVWRIRAEKRRACSPHDDNSIKINE